MRPRVTRFSLSFVALTSLVASVLGGCGGCSKKGAPPAPDASSASLASDGGVAPMGSIEAVRWDGSGPFEGQVIMHVSSVPGRIDQDVTYWVKGGKVRIDQAAQGRPTFRGIFDPSAHKMITVLDESHAFGVMDLSLDAGVRDHWDVKRLGTTGNIADRDCVDYEAKNGKHTVVVCVTPDRFFDLAGIGSANLVQQPWLASIDGFPLRSVEHDESGKEVTKVEVTRVAMHPVLDGQFIVPRNYHRLDSDNPNATTGRMRK